MNCIRNILLLLIICNAVYSQVDDNQGYKLRTLVIDPGHGGRDPGTVGKICKEKDVALAIALKLGTYIEKNLSDVKVIYTRKTDKFVELDKRAQIANENNADLFISIHVNANRSSKIRGTSTYVMGLHKSDENLEVAKRENSVIKIEDNYASKYEGYDPDSHESEIIFSLVVNTFLDQSLIFASEIENQFKNRAQRHSIGVIQAGFVVLWNTTMPSVLIETGFISNPAEEKYLASKYGQDIIASAIFRAFRSYKEKVERKGKYAVSDTQNSTITPPVQKEEKIPEQVAIIEEPEKKETREVKKTITKNIHLKDIYFSIQVKSSQRKIDLNPSNFNGLQNVRELKVKGVYKYLYGKKYSVDEILRLQKQVRDVIHDAFVVGFINDDYISFREAIKEKNNQNKN